MNNGSLCTKKFLLQGPANTCWFIAALNQFFLIKHGNAILFNALVNYVNTELKSDVGRRDLMDPNVTCPIYGKLHSKFNFYKVLYQFFKGVALNRINSRRIVQNVIITRRGGDPATANWGNTVGTIKAILDRLSIINYNTRILNINTNTITATPRSDVPLPDFYIVTPHLENTWRPTSMPTALFGPQFYLGSALINISISPDRHHSICGVKCGSNYYIVDSNFNTPIRCDWRNVNNIDENIRLRTLYKTTELPTITSSIIDLIYFRKLTNLVQRTNVAQLNNSLRINTKNESFTQEIARATLKWEGYKMAFFRGDANGVLRASFLISYVLFKIEFATIIQYPWKFNSLQELKQKIPLLRNAVSSPNASKQLGFNYKNGSNPVGFGREGTTFYSAMMLLKNSAMNSLIKNGKWVDINSPEYDAAENNMIAAVSALTNINGNGNFATAIRRSNWKSIFKYTSYGQESKLIGSFYFHSMAMFGWWGFYGIRPSRSNVNMNPNSRGFVPTEHPGSCNVAGLLNMYLWKKMGKLDNLIYIAHGRTQVATIGQINAMTAQRAAGVDDVQFCHHGWQLAGNRPNTSAGGVTSNMPGMGRWWQSTLYSHSDAFDVLTLAPIFRSIQRLRRQKREGRVRYVTTLVSSLNTRIKDFLINHLMSTLPLNVLQNKRGEMTSRNILNPRPPAPRVNNALRRRVAAQSNAAAVQRRTAPRPANQLNLMNLNMNSTPTIYNNTRNFLRTIRSNNYRQLSAAAKLQKLRPLLGPLLNNNSTRMLNFARQVAAAVNINNDSINSFRRELINNNWKTNRSLAKRLLWAASRRNAPRMIKKSVPR